jgi:hypothetical protein
MGALRAQADLLRVPLADGTLVATPDVPSHERGDAGVAAIKGLPTGSARTRWSSPSARRSR